MTTAHPEPLLALGGVSFAYEDRPIFDRISLELSRGESIGILGENGSGKTTLLRLMAGILRPGIGRVALLGRAIETYRRREIARLISVVGQGSDPAFDFTVGETVMMGRHPHIPLFGEEGKGDRERVLMAMERMGIMEIRDQLVTRLSAGEWQRVIIARALAQETPILLLDEPTSSLDIRHQIELVRLLNELRRERQLAMVTVSHDIDLIVHLATRVILIAERTILADGPIVQTITPEYLSRTYDVSMTIEKGAEGIRVRMPWDQP